MARNGKGRGRRRPKDEDSTGAKAGATETRQISAVLKVADGDKIKHHMATVKGYKDKIATMQSHLRNAYKAAKADHVPKSIIDDLLALERGDPAAFRAEMETLAAGLKAIGAPFQLNVFDISYSSDVEQARAEAAAAAKAGRGPECRFTEGSEAFDAYMQTYSEVQATMVPGADQLSEEERNGAVQKGLEGGGAPLWDQKASETVATAH